MNEDVGWAIDEAFPDRAVDELSDPGPSWNEGNETVEVAFEDGETAYLKVAADGDGSRIRREEAVVAHVRANSGVPVPAILDADPDAAVPYLATAPVDGQNHLDAWYGDGVDEDRRAEIAREVGRALADLHAIRFPERGHVVDGGADDLTLDAAPWTDVLVDTVRDAREIAIGERFDGYYDRVIDAVERNRDLLDQAPAALLHGDPAHPNAFRTEDGTGFLDWEIAHVGDPVREIRRARRQQIEPLYGEGSDRLVEALHEGYRQRAGGLPDGFEDRRPVYDAVTFLGTAGFFEKWAPDADRPTEDLAEWVEETMEDALAAI